MFRTEDEWMGEYERKSAVWIHGGSPQQPHVILTSGNHSGAYFQSKLVFEENDELRREAASDLVEKLVAAGQNLMLIDCVVGPATGATKLAESIASCIAFLRGVPCRWASPEKDDADGSTFSFKASHIMPGDRVLVCDDALTRGGSIEKTMDAVRRDRGSVLFRVLVVVNRNGERYVNGRQLISLIHRKLPDWNPLEEACPLCGAGSEAIKPKSPPENWERLRRLHPSGAGIVQ